jgi:transposase
VTKIICGGDVSKARLDVAISDQGAISQFNNNPEGINDLIVYCKENRVDIVVLEASGGYERLAFALLSAAGIACAIVNPGNVRNFAKAIGILEKTDGIDARVICRYGAVIDVKPTTPPTQEQSQLKAFAARLRQITADISVQKQRKATALNEMMRESIDEVIALFNRQARKISGEIASMIDDDPLWGRLNTAFREIKGVADRTCAYLLAELPEIGIYSNKAIAKLVGLAPIANDSGQRNGKRYIKGGRAKLRSILYLISRTAIKYNAELKAFHGKLIAAGKPKMVARIAVAHKILVKLNAKARDARAAFANAT